MKKIIILFLVLFISFTLIGCKKNNNSNYDNNNDDDEDIEIISTNNEIKYVKDNISIVFYYKNGIFTNLKMYINFETEKEAKAAYNAYDNTIYGTAYKSVTLNETTITVSFVDKIINFYKTMTKQEIETELTNSGYIIEK